MNETFERLFIAAKEIKSIKNKADLARLLNISQQTLKNWESRGISSQGVIESAAILNISTQWLTSGHGQMKNGDSSHALNNLGTQNNYLSNCAENIQTIIMPDSSFSPHIPQSSELTYDTKQTSITDGKIYLIKLGERLFIRRVFYQISGSLKLVCDNKDFGDDEIAPDNVQIIGRVIEWKVSDR